jgi:hypothetical protein
MAEGRKAFAMQERTRLDVDMLRAEDAEALLYL